VNSVTDRSPFKAHARSSPFAEGQKSLSGILPTMIAASLSALIAI
jgi:hypothetical protein